MLVKLRQPKKPCDHLNVVKIRSKDDTLSGIFCEECKTEYLKERYLQNRSDTDIIEFEDEHLFRRGLPALEEKTAFQIQSPVTFISLKVFAHSLKPGDHISWQRPYIIWHHAIIVDIEAEQGELCVIHWTKQKSIGQCRIVLETLKVDPNGNGMFGSIYRIDYPDAITQINPPELVLARALSQKDQTDYSFFWNNCESFATYCKTGIFKSHQYVWLKGKLYTCVFHTIGLIATCLFNVIQYYVSGVMRDLPIVVQRGNLLGCGFVNVIEGTSITLDLKQAVSEWKNSNINFTYFIQVVIQRIIEGVFGAGLIITFTLVPQLIDSAVGIPYGPIAFIGSLFGGVIGCIIGKITGTALGSWIGTLISYCINVHDKAVKLVCECSVCDRSENLSQQCKSKPGKLPTDEDHEITDYEAMTDNEDDQWEFIDMSLEESWEIIDLKDIPEETNSEL